jgi:hypothetical protein
VIPADAHRFHFDALTREQQVEAICKLADDGFGDYDIGAATGLSVEQIRAILGERRSTS